MSKEPILPRSKSERVVGHHREAMEEFIQDEQYSISESMVSNASESDNTIVHGSRILSLLCPWYTKTGVPEMTTFERIRLSPFQKWRKFGRVPWKLIINIILLILTTTQVLIFNMYVAPYERSQIATWQSLIVGDSENVKTVGAYSTKYFYTVDSLTQSLSDIVNIYYNIQNYTVDYYEYIYESDSQDIRPIVLTTKTYTSGMSIFDSTSSFDDSTTTQNYNLTKTSLGPFDLENTELNDFIYSLLSMNLHFDVRNYDSRLGSRYCFRWSVRAKYDFISRGRISMVSELVPRICLFELDQPWYSRQNTPEILLFAFILAFATVSQVLHLKAISRSFQIYRLAKRRLQTVVEWKNLSFEQKRKFFNVWFFTTSIGNFCNIIGSLLGIIYDVNGTFSLAYYRLLFSGLGCMTAWFVMVQYFEHSGSYYILILTLKKGTPRVIRFVVGVLPIFLGYALFGVSFFSPYSENFSTLDQASVTLFALLNGDVVHDVFDELYPQHPIISRIYLYSFISLFIYAVLNIFIAIIEDAFFAAKAFSLKNAGQGCDYDILDLLEGPPISGSPKSHQSHDFSINSDSFNGSGHSHEPKDHSGIVSVPMKGDPNSFQSSLLSSFDKHIQNIRRNLLNSIESRLGKEQSQDHALYRPPHDDKFFPCGFKDCPYCSLRIRCRNVIQDFGQAVQDITSETLQSKDYFPENVSDFEKKND